MNQAAKDANEASWQRDVLTELRAIRKLLEAMTFRDGDTTALIVVVDR